MCQCCKYIIVHYRQKSLKKIQLNLITRQLMCSQSTNSEHGKKLLLSIVLNITFICVGIYLYSIVLYYIVHHIYLLQNSALYYSTHSVTFVIVLILNSLFPINTWFCYFQ